MRERPYAITIMDKQGRVYFLTGWTILKTIKRPWTIFIDIMI